MAAKTVAAKASKEAELATAELVQAVQVAEEALSKSPHRPKRDPAPPPPAPPALPQDKAVVAKRAAAKPKAKAKANGGRVPHNLPGKWKPLIANVEPRVPARALVKRESTGKWCLEDLGRLVEADEAALKEESSLCEVLEFKAARCLAADGFVERPLQGRLDKAQQGQMQLQAELSLHQGVATGLDRLLDSSSEDNPQKVADAKALQMVEIEKLKIENQNAARDLAEDVMAERESLKSAEAKTESLESRMKLLQEDAKVHTKAVMKYTDALDAAEKDMQRGPLLDADRLITLEKEVLELTKESEKLEKAVKATAVKMEQYQSTIHLAHNQKQALEDEKAKVLAAKLATETRELAHYRYVEAILARAMIFRIGKKMYLHGVALQQAATKEEEEEKEATTGQGAAATLREVGYKLDRMRKIFVNDLPLEQCQAITTDVKRHLDRLQGSYKKRRTDRAEADECERWTKILENLMLTVKYASAIEFSEHRKGVLDTCKLLLELEEQLASSNDPGALTLRALCPTPYTLHGLLMLGCLVFGRN